MVRRQYLSRVRDHYIDYPIVPVSQPRDGFIAELRHDSAGPWEVAQVFNVLEGSHNNEWSEFRDDILVVGRHCPEAPQC